MRDIFQICQAFTDDADEILHLQKRAYLSEAEIYKDFSISPLTQSFESIQHEFKQCIFLKVVYDDEIVGSVRAYREGDTCYIGKLIVDKEYRNMGVGQRLMREAEEIFNEAKRFELFTGCRSEKNLYLYQKLGYKIFKREHVNDKMDLVYMEKFV